MTVIGRCEGERIYMDKELAELRADLKEIRRKIGECVNTIEPLRQKGIKDKVAYKRALASAKIKYKVLAKDKEDKLPTIINAKAEIDHDVVEKENAMIISEGALIAAEKQLEALEEDCKAVKKSMGTIETEMRTFGG